MLRSGGMGPNVTFAGMNGTNGKDKIAKGRGKFEKKRGIVVKQHARAQYVRVWQGNVFGAPC
jgi:hypothetical protein